MQSGVARAHAPAHAGSIPAQTVGPKVRQQPHETLEMIGFTPNLLLLSGFTLAAVTVATVLLGCSFSSVVPNASHSCTPCVRPSAACAASQGAPGRSWKILEGPGRSWIPWVLPEDPSTAQKNEVRQPRFIPHGRRAGG